MKKIYLVDANSFIYRMFFWLPEFSTKDWKVVNAIFGIWKFFVNQLTKEKPDYLFFIKDAKWKNFRHELYSDYKATRNKMPDNLKSQIKDIEKMIKLMWISLIEVNWYEADDVIWTLATNLGKNKTNDIYILSSDKDLYSLVKDNVKIYDTMKKQVFNWKKTEEKFWIKPEEIIDYLSIVWDKSDNIPGIDWFWPKKAIELIKQIWAVEEIYEVVEEINSWKKSEKDLPKSVQSCFRWKTFEKLIKSKENAFLSKKLATLDLSINLNCKPFIDEDKILSKIEEKINPLTPIDKEEYKENLNFLENFKFDWKSILNEKVKNFFKELEFNSLIWKEEKSLKVWRDLNLKVNTIWNSKWLKELKEKIDKYSEIILDTETTSIDITKAKLTWISIYLDRENIFYINRLHKWNQVNDSDLKDFLNYIFEKDILIVWHNIKYDLEIIELFMKK